MKQFISIFLSAVLASAVLIGCGLVDDNVSQVEAENPAVVERSTVGSFAKHDTTGYE